MDLFELLVAEQLLSLQIHWPGFPVINNFVTNSFVEGLGRAKLAGLTDAVGVSNFKAERVREANKILNVSFSSLCCVYKQLPSAGEALRRLSSTRYDWTREVFYSWALLNIMLTTKLHFLHLHCTTSLQDKGVPLASNQVQYSLLYRAPERNGVIQACKDTNTALLAYSPITQGLLSGTAYNCLLLQRLHPPAKHSKKFLCNLLRGAVRQSTCFFASGLAFSCWYCHLHSIVWVTSYWC